ncbi:hypothetical protein J2X41_004014 [Caulobacter sp. BE254]|nr:hypothetical protein [Caulobacter sp. BE254]
MAQAFPCHAAATTGMWPGNRAVPDALRGRLTHPFHPVRSPVAPGA